MNKNIRMDTQGERESVKPLLVPYPWVQLKWHGSQRPCLLGYLKMTPSPPITPSGHEETQCGPSCRLAHATHWFAPLKERERNGSKWQYGNMEYNYMYCGAIRWQQHTQRQQRTSYRACAGLLTLLDLTLRVAWHTLPWSRSKLPPLPTFREKGPSLSKSFNRLQIRLKRLGQLRHSKHYSH